VLLCELHDRSVAEAAAELGWPVGTVASRLSRGRALLAARLSRRGLALGSALVLAGGLSRAAAAAVPGRLVPAAVGAACGPVSPPAVVVSLASEVRRAMNHWKVQLLVAGLVAAAVVAAVAGLGPVSSSAAPAPASAGVPTATLDRVRLTDLSGILRQESVRKDLKLTEEQARAVEEERTKVNADLRGKVEAVMKKMVFGQLGGGAPPGPPRMRLDPEVMTGILNDHHARLEQQVLALLTPEQVRRLRQINLQVGGVAALLDRRVIRELQLSADQEDRIDVLVRKRTTGLIPAEDTARAAQKNDALLTEALQILTPVQRQKWEALVGKPIPAADLIKAGPFSEETQAENSSSGAIRGRTPPKGAAPPVPNKPNGGRPSG
jgi:RNA polymerase sigma-70 factor (ECF subfamily)